MNPLKAETGSVAWSLDRAAALLGAAGVEQPRRDARLLLAEVLGGRPELVTGYPERVLEPGEAVRFQDLIHRRAAREPVSRILGRREFWSLDLRLGAEVLDPRPDSETLVEAVLSRLDDREAPLRVLDLGTGSGCLLLALLSELPRARGLGVDISAPALAVARDNARRLGLLPRAAFCRGDWAEGLTGSWQVIVSNPPYIMESAIDDLAPEVARYDPRLALSGGADGLAAYRSLVPQVGRLLTPGGLLALEVGPGQAREVEQLFGLAGLASLGCRCDLAGNERCLLATKRHRVSRGYDRMTEKNSWKEAHSRLGLGCEPKAPASPRDGPRPPYRVRGFYSSQDRRLAAHEGKRVNAVRLGITDTQKK